MEEKLTIYDRLLAVQVELKAPKGQFNKFGGYKYRSCEDILEAVKPLLGKHGMTLTLSDEPVLVGDWHYVKATATLSSGGESIAVTAYAREELTKKGMDASQITGTASSYARKYALNGIFCIDDTKDADATNDHGKQPVQAAPQPDQPRYAAPAPVKSEDMAHYPVTEQEYQELRGLFGNAAEGHDMGRLLAEMQAALGFKPTRDMSRDAWSQACQWLSSRIVTG